MDLAQSQPATELDAVRPLLERLAVGFDRAGPVPPSFQIEAPFELRIGIVVGTCVGLIW